MLASGEHRAIKNPYVLGNKWNSSHISVGGDGDEGDDNDGDDGVDGEDGDNLDDNDDGDDYSMRC